MAGSITIQCINGSCKKKRTLSMEEAANLTDQPCCGDCGSVMVVRAARISSRRSGRDLRGVIENVAGQR